MGKNKTDASQEISSGVSDAHPRHQEMKQDHSVTGAGETSVSKATAERDTDYGADGADLDLDDITPEVTNRSEPDSSAKQRHQNDNL